MIENLFVSTTFMPDNSPLQEVLELCVQSNVCAVEIGSNHAYNENYDFISKYNFKYLVHNYFPIPRKSFVINIASIDKSIRDRSIEHIKRAIDFCDKFNVLLYTFHPGFITDPHGSNKASDNYDFTWDENQLEDANLSIAKHRMHNSLEDIIQYAKARSVKIAIETEGSFYKRDHLLMQRPEEFIDFCSRYKASEIGINLNIGHLTLAAKAFEFNPTEFVYGIAGYIVAMELSHNDGNTDQHLPLQYDGWYWDMVLDSRFSDAFKILEYRNTSIDDMVKSIKLFEARVDDF